MEEAFNKFIIDNFGLSVFIMCAVIIGIIFLSIWCYKIYVKVKHIDDLPCNKHQEKMYAHDNAVTRIETSIKFLTKEMETAMKIFQQQNLIKDGFTQTHSPLSITDKGWEMIRRLGVDKMFENNWTRIKSLITENVEHKNAYDINNFCIEQAVVYPEKFLSESETAVLKDDAYQNGDTLASYMKVIAVLARDRYFKETGLEEMKP